MDAQYIITRLKSSLYKYSTAEVLKIRLQNLKESDKQQVMSQLKIELWRECNLDIFEPLSEVMQRSRRAA
jgi:hypothetical protein